MADETIDVTTTETALPTDPVVTVDCAVTEPVPSTPVAANDQASSNVATGGAPPIDLNPTPAEPAVCEPVDHAAVVAAHGGVDALLVKLHEDVAFLRSIFGWPENK